MTASPLISVEELATSPDRFHTCDLRWDLTDPDKGRATYQKGHIPGAVFVDLDRDLAAPAGQQGRHPLPDVTTFATTLGRLGIGPETDVVAYDDAGARYAARLWWMLVSIGHDRVQVLDGGLPAWMAAGHDMEIGNVTPDPTDYPMPRGFSGVATYDHLQGRTLIDARESDRYRGDFEPIDPKAGHIPGAINIPTSENLQADDRFRHPDELVALYSHLPADRVVSCGSGVTACHDALAMVVAGERLPDVYVGSFSEWSRLDLPVATGSEP